MANIEMNVLKVGNSEFEIADAAARQDVNQLKEDLTAAQVELAKKANTDGYYEEMTVGDAEQLVSTVTNADDTPYNFRTTAGSADVGDRAYIDAIVGGTLSVNQLAPILSSEKWEGNSQFGTCVFDGNKATYTITQKSGSQSVYISNVKGGIPLIKDHKYVVEFDATISQSTSSLSVNVMDTQWVSCPSVQANTKQHCAKVFNSANATGGNAYFGIYPSTGAGVNIGGTFVLENVVVIDLTAMFGSTIADYIYSLEQSTAGAGVAWFRKLFPKDYYEYNAGELLSVSGLASHDTVGFNQWDEEWEVGGISDTTGANTSNTDRIRSKNYIAVLPNTTYYFNDTVNSRLFYYDAEKNFISAPAVEGIPRTFITPSNCHYVRFFSVGTTYNHDICINLSWSGWRNGEYEPYQKHSYPLDDSLTLRGIPKLDAQNNIYYDGDEYLPDGTVNRRYGVVDLGTLNWSYRTTGSSLAPFFYADFNDIKFVGNPLSTLYPLVCDKYVTSIRNVSRFGDNEIVADGDATNITQIQIKDSSYTDAASFKTAMSGVMLVYELATPTTETAEPYQHVQICDDFGTEEYVSTSIVPVGHSTRYPANLRDKLQHLPDLADDDGYYMIGQTNKQMHLELFRIPKAPTTDGTYTLKATVSGGTPTYTWEAET